MTKSKNNRGLSPIIALAVISRHLHKIQDSIDNFAKASDELLVLRSASERNFATRP